MKSNSATAVACQLSLVKGRDRFIVRCTPRDEEAAIAQLMRWAENPDLDFVWFDAAVLSRQVNQQLMGRLSSEESERDHG